MTVSPLINPPHFSLEKYITSNPRQPILKKIAIATATVAGGVIGALTAEQIGGALIGAQVGAAAAAVLTWRGIYSLIQRSNEMTTSDIIYDRARHTRTNPDQLLRTYQEALLKKMGGIAGGSMYALGMLGGAIATAKGKSAATDLDTALGLRLSAGIGAIGGIAAVALLVLPRIKSMSVKLLFEENGTVSIAKDNWMRGAVMGAVQIAGITFAAALGGAAGIAVVGR